ncbi:MAG TPA: 16S rRNA (cytidine(1402)-2'-O)-methyltransferase [Clostridiales bacterium]|nr:16S rRNA (cytidine(1402)-2'-O)-methyltransferase [Clostridiales bacterium]HPV02798.1 16S rRNA (cytidine(1402)-2'-O)-methyltransferase [Clostridiales bacterium]
MGKTGTLYLVATPIGNLEDITLRALRILKEADIIAAEDTRQTLKLLNHFGIKNTLVSYYEHNKAEKGNYLIGQLLEGRNVALVSDAGTPGISDPGEDLVRLAADNGIPVTLIPGPSAVIAGVVLSGLPSGRFAFEGFLPVNRRARRERLESVSRDTRTLVFYEAPHKLIHTLKDLRDVFGNRRVAIARELTKRFEEVWRTTLDEAVARYEKETPKGEFVLILEGADERGLQEEEKKSWEDISIEEHVRMYTDSGLDKKEAMKRVAEDRGISKREVYSSLLGKD